MSTLRKTALVTALGATLMLAPGSAQAGHWHGWGPASRVGFDHPWFFPGPAAAIGLGIAGAAIGTAAIVNALVPHPVYVAPQPTYAAPPSSYDPYDDAYRRGYDAGRRDSYDDERPGNDQY
jgi:hypothetical protein